MFQDWTIGCVADSDGTFAARAESNAGGQADLGFQKQPLAEIEGVGSAGDFWEQIERAVGLRHGDAGHLCERRQAEIAIFFEANQHFRQRVLAP